MWSPNSGIKKANWCHYYSSSFNCVGLCHHKPGHLRIFPFYVLRGSFETFCSWNGVQSFPPADYSRLVLFNPKVKDTIEKFVFKRWKEIDINKPLLLSTALSLSFGSYLALYYHSFSTQEVFRGGTYQPESRMKEAVTAWFPWKSDWKK